MSVHRELLPVAAFGVTAWAWYVQHAFNPGDGLSIRMKLAVSLVSMAMATFVAWLTLSILFP